MKTLFLISLLSLGCVNNVNKTGRNTLLDNNVIVSNNKPKIELLLKDQINTLKDGMLNICCYNYFSVIPQIELSKLTVKNEVFMFGDEKITVDVYTYGDSYFKRFFSKEDEENKIALGEIKDVHFPFKDKMFIGMDKRLFLNEIFQESDLYHEFDTLTISEDELGLSHTSYIFENNLLKKIIFNSTNDWIK